jgi:hypothetical protein
MEYVRYGRDLSRVPPPVAFDAVLSVAAGPPIPIGTRSEKRASILSNRILLHVTTRLCSLSGVSGAVAVAACAKVTILTAASRLE